MLTESFKHLLAWQTEDDNLIGLGLLGGWLEAKVGSNALNLGSRKHQLPGGVRVGEVVS